MELFATAVKYGKMMEDGIVKSVTEQYLTEAVSHADAESRIVEEMSAFVSEDLEVTKVQKVLFSEVVTTEDSDAEEFWKVNISFITLDEKTAKEKRTAAKLLVQCGGYHDCVKRFDAAMKGSMIDFEVTALSKTKYLEIFKNKE